MPACRCTLVPEEQRLLEDACAEARRAARLVVLFGPAAERLAPFLDPVPLLRAGDVEGGDRDGRGPSRRRGALLVSPMFPLPMGERAVVAPALESLARPDEARGNTARPPLVICLGKYC